MLKYYIKSAEAFKRLRADQDGVVSFEYVIVAACIIVAVGAAFGLSGSGALSSGLSSAISAVVAKLTSAVS
ncbi:MULTISPECIES: hypothetical protein [Bradyrhizobium]|uniref:Flp family type IVb pilin n=1 Tax=Bradyrhizobium brasilense TaxID=1419277 RepID=A0ABY8JBS6_9BRAD|nr:hypothetical protein [Bradyrhizobium brasilense]WFU61428.1 hypothetical protein QA636_28520 [Bradyrhizobium brasilense]